MIKMRNSPADSPTGALTVAGAKRYLLKVQTKLAEPTTVAIREQILRDSRYPVHRIADDLLPYLRVLVERFHPQQVILFGSYACGHPGPDSDVDLIIVKDLERSPVLELTEILKAWRPIRWRGRSLPFELLIENPLNHERRAKQVGSFYADAVRTGLRLA